MTAFFLLLSFGCKDQMDGPVESPAYNPYPVLAEVDSTVACDRPPLWNWFFIQQIPSLGPEIIPILQNENLKITDLAFFHSLYVENSPADQSFGPNGEYTDQINTSAADIKRFWGNAELDNIILVASHGSVLQDRNKVVATFKSPQYGYSDQKANAYADSVATLFGIHPLFLNGQHPAFTYNQLAIPDTTFAGFGRIPAKIIIGDGLLQGFDAIGYGDIAPQAILAHEYAHHIQYDLGIVVRGWQRGKELIPKTSRRIELMADAYAAYYLSHPRGAAMRGESVQRFLQVFSNLGDCEFKGDSHHGTPAQRMGAAEWGANLATNTHKEGQILSGLEFARLFDAALADIVKK